MEDIYIACLVLHAAGDTIGFKNGEWEFKKGHITDRIFEKIYEFVDYGGINFIPKKDWRVSDDTILHMKNAYALLEDFETVNSFGKILTKKYIEAYDQFLKEGLEYRYPGITTMENFKKLKEGTKWDEMHYYLEAGGSGASMRSLCIGLAFYGEENRQKLIQMAIESSRMTHNSTVGYLGGMTSALFTAYAIEGIDIKKWPLMLMDLFTDDVIKNYIRKAKRGYQEFMRDQDIFIDKWKRYMEDKFDEKGNPIKRRSTKNLIFRSKYYWDNFGYKKKAHFFPGSGGDDSVIIAYDSLLDAEDSWEKLVFYSMLHAGDTDTTGCIAAGWRGAIMGFADIPEIIFKNLEYKDELKKIGQDLYKKYYRTKP